MQASTPSPRSTPATPSAPRFYSLPIARPRSRTDTLVVVALALLGGLTRLPFVRPTPINWDAVQFALALDRFDLHLHQPHPPGYVLYVGLAGLLNVPVGQPALALSLLSVLFSAAAVPLLYHLSLRIFQDRAVALCAAALLLASPLAIYYGATGLTYAPEMALALAVAIVAWRVRQHVTMSNAALLALALGIAGGVRQTTLPLLLPLCVWALWRAPKAAWVAFALCLVAVCLAWGVPLVALSGGLQAYVAENEHLGAVVSGLTSLPAAGLDGLLNNLGVEVSGLAQGLAFGMVPLGLWLLRLVRFSLSPALRGFLLWWTVPPLLFFAVSHAGQMGYVLFVLPPLLMLSALCVRVLWERLSGDTALAASRAVCTCAVTALLSLAYFAFAPGDSNAPAIEGNNRYWQETLPSALSGMGPQHTALIMGKQWAQPFRHAGYLLPQYHSYAFGADPTKQWGWLYSAYAGASDYHLPVPGAQPYLLLPPSTEWVVALDEQTGERLVGEDGLTRVSLSDGSTLYVLHKPNVTIKGLSAEGEQIRVDWGK